MAQSNQRWSEEELRAVVTAYMLMLDKEHTGQPYIKSEINRELREGALSNRTKGSIEYRMQNISAALQAIGRPYIPGYKPAKNVGSNVIEQLQRMLVGQRPDVLAPTDDPQELEKRVAVARDLIKPDSTPPVGQQAPVVGTSTTSSYMRCPQVKAWVLENAAGVCEGCGVQAPFTTDAGAPYLEVHHLNHLAQGGHDTVGNTVALCPNCHRRCHYSLDKAEFISGFTRRVAL
ncbi:MAG: 5-methylcytosine-specific restriction protein A [Motiliproteus sp.]|jgi:5-methylcytosine-specific restriction protein A